MNTPHPRFLAFSGTVTGREHARTRRNNQDGHAARTVGDLAVAVVTDGCGSGSTSEVGARFAAAWLARWLPVYARRGDEGPAWVDDVCRALVRALGSMARMLAPAREERAAVVHDFFLFSFLAAVVSAERAVVFGAGDGVFAIDGRMVVLDPGPENAPSYLAYGLFPERASRPVIHHDGPARAVSSILIATDGAAELQARAAEPLENGEAQGDLLQFTRDARYARNRSLLGKRLAVIGDLHARLSDDTTIAVLRAKETA
jgi:hypothetical protein